MVIKWNQILSVGCFKQHSIHSQFTHHSFIQIFGISFKNVTRTNSVFPTKSNSYYNVLCNVHDWIIASQFNEDQQWNAGNIAELIKYIYVDYDNICKVCWKIAAESCTLLLQGLYGILSLLKFRQIITIKFNVTKSANGIQQTVEIKYPTPHHHRQNRTFSCRGNNYEVILCNIYTRSLINAPLLLTTILKRFSFYLQ